MPKTTKSTETQKGNRHVYAKTFAAVIEAMEAGKLAWRRPWAGGHDPMPRNAASKRPYHGGNVLALWCAQAAGGYALPLWLTYNQAKAAGGNVRAGEKGTAVYFMSTFRKKGEDGEKSDDTFWLARGFTVFNIDQCDGLETLRGKWVTEQKEEQTHADIPRCRRVVQDTGATIKHGGDRACYSLLRDEISMPQPKAFDTREAYYGTLFHELVHWTGHHKRLNREQSGIFGSPEYAIEELVAEIGAAFLGARFRIESIDQSAAYLQSWLKALKNDPSYLARAASAAWKAAEHLSPLNDAADVDEEIAAVA